MTSSFRIFGYFFRFLLFVHCQQSLSIFFLRHVHEVLQFTVQSVPDSRLSWEDTLLKCAASERNHHMSKPTLADFLQFFYYMKKSGESALFDSDIVTFPMFFHVKVRLCIFGKKNIYVTLYVFFGTNISDVMRLDVLMLFYSVC